MSSFTFTKKKYNFFKEPIKNGKYSNILYCTKIVCKLNVSLTFTGCHWCNNHTRNNYIKEKWNNNENYYILFKVSFYQKTLTVMTMPAEKNKEKWKKYIKIKNRSPAM
jgi:hypothetical protein